MKCAHCGQPARYLRRNAIGAEVPLCESLRCYTLETDRDAQIIGPIDVGGRK